MTQHAFEFMKVRAAILIALCLPLMAQAGDRTWSGGANDVNLNIPGNWDSIPLTGDSWFFGSANGSQGATLNNDFFNYAVGSITFNSGALTWTIGGNAATLTGNISNLSTNLQTISKNMTLSAVIHTITTSTGGGNLSFGGILSGTGGITKLGSGTLTLSGVATVSGLQANGGNVVVSNTLTINGPSTSYFLYVGNGGNNGGTPSCSGTLTLNTGANIYVTGAFGDSFVIGRDSGNGTVIQNDGLFDFNVATRSFIIGASSSAATTAIYNMNGGTLNVHQGLDLASYGVAAFTSTLNLNGGVIIIGSGGITGTASKARINLAGGTLAASTGWSSALNATLTGAGPTFDATGGNIGWGGALTGTGALTKAGTGTLTLNNTGNINLTGNITVNQGVLQTGNNAVTSLVGLLGSTTTAGRQITVASGATLTFGNNDTLGGWANTPSVTLNINGTVNNSVAVVNALGSVTFNGGVLAATSGYAAGGGIAYALSPGRDVTVTGGASTISLSGGANIGLNGVVTFSVGSGATLTAAGTLSNHPAPTVGGLSKTGPGTMLLAGNNTYTGGTTVNAGTLTLSGGITGGGAVTVANSAVMNIQSGGTLTPSYLQVGLTGSGSAIVNQTGGIVSFTSNTLELLIGNGVGFNGAYNMSGGTLTGAAAASSTRGILLGVNSGTASTPVSATFNLSGGVINMSSQALMVGRNEGGNVNYTTDTYSQTAGTATFGTLAIGGGGAGTVTANFSVAGGSFTAGSFPILGGTTANTASMTIGGTATVQLPAFPNSGGTKYLTFDGGTLVASAASAVYMPAGTFNTATITANGANIVAGGANNITIGQAFQGVGVLTKTGIATLTLSNTGNTNFTGNITVNQGVLQTGGGTGALGSSGTTGRQITVASGATLTFGYSDTFGAWAATPSVTLNILGTVNNSAAVVNALGSVTFNNGVLAASNGFAGGNGTTAYVLSNGYDVTVTGGASTISLSGGARVGLRGAVTFYVASGAMLTAAGTLSNHPDGTVGGLSATGPGTLVLTGSNTYSGNTLVSAGTLTLANNLALQNSAIDTSGAGSIGLTVTTPTFGGLIGSGNLATVITTGYGSVTELTLNPGTGVTDTYSGVITNGATGMTLTKSGTGTQVLAGTDANTYTGVTTAKSGALILSKAAGVAAVPGNLVVYGGANVWATADNQFSANTIVTNGNGTAWACLTLLDTTQTIGGLDNPAGNFMVANSTPNADVTKSPAGSGTGTLILAGSGSYTYGGDMWNGWNSGGVLALNMSGTGTQTLTGAQINYTGSTIVNSGVLSLHDTINFASAVAVGATGTLNIVRTVNGYAARENIAGDSITGSGTINVNNSGTGVAGGWVIVNGASALNFTGTINVKSGVFGTDGFGGLGVFAGSATVNVAADGVLVNHASSGFAIGALNGAGDVTPAQGGNGTYNLTLGAGDQSGTFSGIIHGNNSTGVSDGSMEAGFLSLTKTGTGTQVLAGNNTYLGATTINNGTLRVTGTITSGGVILTVGGNTAGYKGILDISGGTVLANKNTNPSVDVGNGADAVGLITMSSGTLTAAHEFHLATGATTAYGAFVMSGGVATLPSWVNVTQGGVGVMTVSGGTLNVTGTVGSGWLNLGCVAANGKGVLDLSGTGVINVSSTGVYLPQNQTGQFAVLNISGNGQLNITGTGGIVFGAGTSNTGILNLNGGTLTTKVLTSGSPTAIISFNGGTLKAASGATAAFLPTGFTGTYIYGGGATVDDSGQNLTIGQALLAPTGSGVSSITGLTGTGFIAPPIVTIAGDGVGATGVATIDASGNLTGITITSAGTGCSAVTGVTLSGGGGTYAGSESAPLVANTSGGLTKLGSGTLTLTGANTYAGGTTINAGQLTIGTASTVNGSGTISIASSATFNYNSSAAQTLSGAISGGGALIIHGAGTLTLTGANTYTGVTTINAGKLVVNGSLAAGSAVTVSQTAGSAYISGTGTINGAVTLANAANSGINLRDGAVGTLAIGDNLTVSGDAGFNPIVFDLGAGAAGTDKITVGGNMTVTTAGAVVIYLTQIGGAATPINAGTYDLIETAGTMATLDKFVLATTATFGSTYTLQLDGTTKKLQLVVAAGPAGPAAAFWKGGTTGWSSAANWNTDATSDSGAGAPGYGANVSFYTTAPEAANLTNGVLDTDFEINSLNFTADAISPVTIGGATNMMRINATTANGNTAGNGITVMTPGAGAPTHTISAKVGLTANQTWTINSGGSLTISGVVSDSDFGGAYTLTKAGAGALTFSGANTYTGVTTINAGTLAYGASDAIYTGGVTVNGATAVLALGANRTDTVGTVTLDGGGQITGTGASALTSAGAFEMKSGTASAILAGAGIHLNKTTSGVVTLSGNNTYTGGTTISAGTLRVGTGGNTGSLGTGTTLNSATLVWNNTSGLNVTSGNAITGTGAFMIDAGVIVLQTQAGGTVSSGTITVDGTGSGNNSSLLIWAPNSVALNNDFILNSMGPAQNCGAINHDGDSIGSRVVTLTGTITLNGSSRVGVGGLSKNHMDINGKVTGVGKLYVYESQGQWTYLSNSSNDYQGGTEIETGILILGSATAAGTGTITIDDGGRLRTDNFTGTLNNNITLIGGGAISARIGAGSDQTLAGTVTLSGTVGGTAAAISTYSVGHSLTINNPIGGTGDLYFRAGGAAANHNEYFILSGSASTYTGNTWLHDQAIEGDYAANAIVQLQGGALPGTTVLTMSQSNHSFNNDSVLDLNGYNQTLAGLTTTTLGSGGSGWFISNSSDSLSTLTINNNSDYTFDGVIGVNTFGNNQTPGSGNIALTKTGAGKLKLTGVNTYAGVTTINVGALMVDNSSGSGTGTGAVNVIGGTLGGTGTVAGAVSVASGAFLSPGDPSTGGDISVLGTGNVVFQNNSTFVVQVGDAADRITTPGTVEIDSGANLSLSEFGNVQTDRVYTIISATGGVTGAFRNMPNGCPVTLGSSYFTIFYTATTVELRYSGFPGTVIIIR